ncbi:MAG: hypothetical protein EB075_14125, partial [Bacteroidetes bacterium]|nr:hypothetical protein [Bacteroidota bacterium]
MISRYERYQLYLVILIGDVEYSKLSSEASTFRQKVMERLARKPQLRRWYESRYSALTSSPNSEWWRRYGFADKRKFEEGLMGFVRKVVSEDAFGAFSLDRELNFSICNGTSNLNMDRVMKTSNECVYEKDCEEGDDSFDCVERSFKCMWDTVNGVAVTGRSANAKGDPFMSKMPDIDNLSGSKWHSTREGPPGPIGTRSTSKMPAMCSYMDIGSTTSRKVKQSIYLDTMRGGLISSAFSSAGNVVDFGRMKNNIINGVKDTKDGTCERVAIKTVHITDDEFEPVIKQCCTPKYMTRVDIEALQSEDMKRTTNGHATVFCDEVAVLGPILSEYDEEPEVVSEGVSDDTEVRRGFFLIAVLFAFFNFLVNCLLA